MELKIKKLSDKAKIPTNESGLEAGYDLYAVESDYLRPLERKLFKTNISLEIPPGYYGHICDRSGNAYKKGLHVLAGIIDSTYRGDIGVVLYNTNGGDEDKNTVYVEKEKAIAQIIIKKHEKINFVDADSLTETQRGENGYGSSDKTHE
jgi:dUTP pyrophosphatase